MLRVQYKLTSTDSFCDIVDVFIYLIFYFIFLNTKMHLHLIIIVKLYLSIMGIIVKDLNAETWGLHFFFYIQYSKSYLSPT